MPSWLFLIHQKQKKKFMQCSYCKQIVYPERKTCKCGNVVVYVFADHSIVCAPLGFTRVHCINRRIAALRDDKWGTYGSVRMGKRSDSLQKSRPHYWRESQGRDFVLSAELRIAQGVVAGTGGDVSAILRETRRLFGLTTLAK